MEERSCEKSIESGSSISTEQDTKLAIWFIAGDNFAMQTFRSKPPHLSKAREGKALYQITSCTGRSEQAGVLDRKLIHFNVL